MPPLRRVTPLAKLPHAGLKHLIGMNACIFAQKCPGERRHQHLGRVTQQQMAGNQAGRHIDLLLAVKGIEQGRRCCTDRLAGVVSRIG